MPNFNRHEVLKKIHPSLMSHFNDLPVYKLAILQNEFYNVFLKCNNEVYIHVQLSPGSRSDCILYNNIVISEGNCKSSTSYKAMFADIVQV